MHNDEPVNENAGSMHAIRVDGAELDDFRDLPRSAWIKATSPRNGISSTYLLPSISRNSLPSASLVPTETGE